MNSIKLDAKLHSQLDEITRWLKANVGPGSRRFKTNTWLGAEDWLFYENAAEDIEEDEYPDIDDFEPDLIFVFRRESDMTLFSLRWAV